MSAVKGREEADALAVDDSLGHVVCCRRDVPCVTAFCGKNVSAEDWDTPAAGECVVCLDLENKGGCPTLGTCTEDAS